MRQPEILLKMALGSTLSSMLNPWGDRIRVTKLEKENGGHHFIPEWQTERMLKHGLIEREPNIGGGSFSYLLTVTGRERAVVEARRQGLSEHLPLVKVQRASAFGEAHPSARRPQRTGRSG